MRRRISIVAWTIGAAAFASSLSAPGQVAPDFERYPVLFVHGHGLDASDWRTLIPYLSGNGYPKEYLLPVSIVPNTMANADAAANVIAPAAETLLRAAHRAAERSGFKGKLPDKVDVIGYSMGAVSSRWYTVKLRPDRVRTLVTLAGANHGTNALCGYNDPGGRELCPAYSADDEKNRVQVTLNGTVAAPLDETPFGVGKDRDGVASVAPDVTRRIVYYSVRIEPDAWIKPERSATLDGAGGSPFTMPRRVAAKETSPGNFLIFGSHRIGREVDHDSLPHYADLHRLVAALLLRADDAPRQGMRATKG